MDVDEWKLCLEKKCLIAVAIKESIERHLDELPCVSNIHCVDTDRLSQFITCTIANMHEAMHRSGEKTN